MFDPFGDFDTHGYLRNTQKEKDLERVKQFEHVLFSGSLEDALKHLNSKRVIAYKDFLHVHKILFKDFYPWAGTDRSQTAPHSAISKGSTTFFHPMESQRAINEGLRFGNDKDQMRAKPGFVMGMFAYGHPFLDGNGRTILLVHLELTHRAGFSIAWTDTNKSEYLAALSAEIETPNKGILDDYLRPFIQNETLPRNQWGESIRSIKGLDGLNDPDPIAEDFSDPDVLAHYREMEAKRSYTYASINHNDHEN